MRHRLFVKSCAGALFAFALAFVPASALAQNCADQSAPSDRTTAFTRLAALEMGGCLGGDNDKSAVASQVRAALKPTIAADAPDGNPFADALTVLQHRAAALSNGDAIAIFTELAGQIARARDLLGTNIDPARPIVWLMNDGAIPVLSGSLEARVERACQPASQDCTAEFERVREVLRLARLTRLVLNQSFAPFFQAHLDETSKRLKQWGEYFDTARSQYPWELFINSKAMGDSREVIEGVKQGYRNVPSQQFIVLHPTMSFEYDRNQPKGQQMNVVAVVDVFGINRWSWNTDGSMGTAIGATAIASIGDKASGSNVAWGAMVHVNHKYSVGFTVRGDDRALLVSADVPKLWAKVPQSVRERIAGGSDR